MKGEGRKEGSSHFWWKILYLIWHFSGFINGKESPSKNIWLFCIAVHLCTHFCSSDDRNDTFRSGSLIIWFESYNSWNKHSIFSLRQKDIKCPVISGFAIVAWRPSVFLKQTKSALSFNPSDLFGSTVCII